MSDGPRHRMYDDLAPWWPLLSAPADYAEEAAFYTRVILDAKPDARTVLELGSGTGKNTEYHKQNRVPPAAPPPAHGAFLIQLYLKAAPPVAHAGAAAAAAVAG